MPGTRLAAMSTYAKLLQEQIRNEFTASQQYTAVAVWYDDQDLPQLAGHFYKQSLEERNHAMMMVQYLLDMDIRPQIPGVGDVVNDFKSALEPLELALQQEITVTKQIETLARTARDDGDYVGEQFMQWFLKEQVEEVSAMTTLVNVAKRAGDNLFHLEDFLAREVSSANTTDPTAPAAAGGTV
ncbi:ferritin [Kribbella voronezhensis]|uniref:Ferritin n=2 Tax=Kribbella voronezhensis TaxID=2512212 RepID=A0A4R7SYK5_9ACTN|nr:ferritin [Kribbella voronezhensis]